MLGRGAAFAAAISLGVAGCTTLPPLEGPLTPIPVAAIVDRVQCELKQAVLRYEREYPWLLTWTTTFNLSLTVSSEGTISPSAVFTELVSGGTFTFGLNVGVTGTAQRIAILNFTTGLSKMRSYECHWSPVTSGLNSNLGLEEWMGTVLGAVDRKDTVEHVDGFGHTVQFTVVASGGVAPSFALVRFKGPAANGNLLGGKRTDEHKLVMSFAGPEKPKKPKPGEKAVPTPVMPGAVRQRLDQLQLQQQLQSILPGLVR